MHHGVMTHGTMAPCLKEYFDEPDGVMTPCLGLCISAWGLSVRASLPHRVRGNMGVCALREWYQHLTCWLADDVPQAYLGFSLWRVGLKGFSV